MIIELVGGAMDGTVKDIEDMYTPEVMAVDVRLRNSKTNETKMVKHIYEWRNYPNVEEDKVFYDWCGTEE